VLGQDKHVNTNTKITMKKREMIDTLTKQGQDIKKELNKMQEEFNQKKEQLIRIEGALEALSIVEDDVPEKISEETPDHTEAIQTLSEMGI
jgi:hypothetical protein